MRSRERGAFAPGTIIGSGTDNEGNPVTVQPVILAEVAGSKEWCVDEVHPDFRKRSAAGEVIIGYLDKTFESRNMTSGTYSRAYTGSLTTYTYNGPIFPWFFGMPVGSRAVPSSVLDPAIVSAHAKVAAPALQAMVSGLEYRQTVAMFQQIGQKARTLSKMIRSGRVSSQFFENGWLEYRYGWGPLVSDLKGFVELLNNLAKRHPRHTVRGYSSASDYWEETYNYDYGGMHAVGKAKINEKIDVRAGVLYEDHMTDQDFINSRLGFSVYHAPETAWELIPFSFVVDWFLNVGDWLQAIRPKPGVKILGSWVTYFQVTTVEYSIPSFYNDASSTQKITSMNGGGAKIMTNKVRMSAGVPLLPASGSGLNLLRGIDGAMLALQQLRRLIR